MDLDQLKHDLEGLSTTAQALCQRLAELGGELGEVRREILQLVDPAAVAAEAVADPGACPEAAPDER